MEPEQQGYSTGPEGTEDPQLLADSLKNDNLQLNEQVKRYREAAETMGAQADGYREAADNLSTQLSASQDHALQLSTQLAEQLEHNHLTSSNLLNLTATMDRRVQERDDMIKQTKLDLETEQASHHRLRAERDELVVQADLDLNNEQLTNRHLHTEVTELRAMSRSQTEELALLRQTTQTLSDADNKKGEIIISLTKSNQEKSDTLSEIQQGLKSGPDQTNREYQLKITQLEATINEQGLSDNTAMIEALKNDLSMQHHQHGQELETQARRMEALNKQLADEYNSLDTECGTLRTRVAQLEAEQRATIVYHEQELHTQARRMDALNKQLADEHNKLEIEQRATIAELETYARQAHSPSDSATNDELQTLNSALNKRIQGQASIEDQLNMELEELSQTTDRQDELIWKLQHQNEDLQKQPAVNHQQLDKLRSDVSEACNSVATLRKELAQEREANRDLSEKILGLTEVKLNTEHVDIIGRSQPSNDPRVLDWANKYKQIQEDLDTLKNSVTSDLGIGVEQRSHSTRRLKAKRRGQEGIILTSNALTPYSARQPMTRQDIEYPSSARRLGSHKTDEFLNRNSDSDSEDSQQQRHSPDHRNSGRDNRAHTSRGTRESRRPSSTNQSNAGQYNYPQDDHHQHHERQCPSVSKPLDLTNHKIKITILEDDGSNFALWNNELATMVQLSQLRKVVNGRIQWDADISEPDDNVLRAFISRTVSPSRSMMITSAGCTTSKKAFSTLKEQCCGDQGNAATNLQYKLSRMSYQEGTDINKFITELDTIYAQLDQLGAVTDDNLKKNHLIRRVSDASPTWRSFLELIDLHELVDFETHTSRKRNYIEIRQKIWDKNASVNEDKRLQDEMEALHAKKSPRAFPVSAPQHPRVSFAQQPDPNSMMQYYPAPRQYSPPPPEPITDNQAPSAYALEYAANAAHGTQPQVSSQTLGQYKSPPTATQPPPPATAPILGPEADQKPCTNPNCVQAGSADNHSFRDCGRFGGPKYGSNREAFEARKKERQDKKQTFEKEIQERDSSIPNSEVTKNKGALS